MRKRLYFGYISMILLFAIFALVVMNMMASMDADMEDMVYNRYAKAKLSLEAVAITDNLGEGLARLFINEEGGKKGVKAAIANSKYMLEEHLDKLASMVDSSEGQQLYTAMESGYQEYAVTIDEYLRLIADGGDARSYLLGELEQRRIALVEALSQFSALQDRLMDMHYEAAADKYRLVRITLWLGVGLLLLMCTLTAVGVVRSAIGSIRYIAGVMNQVKEGRLLHLPRMQLQANDELTGIAVAYHRMADVLEEQARQERAYNEALEDQAWLKANVAKTTHSYQGEKDIRQFARRFLSQVVPAAGACGGAFYFEEGGRLTALAHYAQEPADGEAAVKSFCRSEGLVGQCAADGIVIETKAPPGYSRVVSGLGSSDGVHLLLLPVSYIGRVVAVLELISFTPATSLQRAYLHELTAGTLGVYLHNLSNHMQIERLLGESQQYVEELQTQSEELQQQQEELRSLNEKLEYQFRESETRGRELERIKSQLEEKAAELQASSQFKSEFLANMSHELRTPLNSLLILAQMLADNLEGNLNAKQIEYARTILYSGNTLLTLINDILDLSKIEAGHLELTEEPLLLSELTVELKRQFAAIAVDKMLSVHFYVEPEIADITLIADKRRLVQILNNLLSNAFKFTEAGSVSMRVYAQPSLPAENVSASGLIHVCFEIRDTGIGIAEDKQQLVFEAFRQADGKTNRKYGGTGLGLPISKELASLMGGSISLQSAPGSGSTFTVHVPMKLEQLDESVREAAPAAQQLMPAEPHVPDIAVDISPAGGQGKILIVDDDIRNVYALSAGLTEHRYEIVYADNGKIALDKLVEHPDIDLVLMDLMMPEMDGYETMRKIRSDSSHAIRTVPIIAVTAKAMKQDRELCLEAGADDYLSKPIKLEKLLSLIRVWMHGRRTER